MWNVYFQINAWADTPFSVKWVDQNSSRGTGALFFAL